jgi:hypothetical protein
MNAPGMPQRRVQKKTANSTRKGEIARVAPAISGQKTEFLFGGTVGHGGQALVQDIDSMIDLLSLGVSQGDDNPEVLGGSFILHSVQARSGLRGGRGG